MIDYTVPPITDETALKLANSINNFTDKTVSDIRNLTDIVQTELYKRYYVNHEPHVELPLDSEYNYTCDVINDSLTSGTINYYPHLFISGYLPSGEKLQFKPYSADPNTLDNYSAVYINGQKVDFSISEEYICQAEAGSWEKLNLMFVATSPNSPKLVVEYSDVPLKKFDIIVYDDTSKSANVDVGSFIGSLEIGSLKYIGDLTWSYYGVSTLRSLEVTGDISVTGEMKCPSLSTLIIPNVNNVPNTNTLVKSKNNLWNIDISNVRNTVGNLQYANFGALTLKCKKIDDFGLDSAYIDTLDTGNNCMTIGESALANSPVREIKIGKATRTISSYAIYNNTELQEIVIDADGKLKVSQHAINDCKNLLKISFSETSNLTLESFAFFMCTSVQQIDFGIVTSATDTICNRCDSLTDISFPPNSITAKDIGFRHSSDLSEQACLNLINGIVVDTKIRVVLVDEVKTKMRSDWYCKLVGDMYISCDADDEGAMLQTEALIAKGGTLQ